MNNNDFNNNFDNNNQNNNSNINNNNGQNINQPMPNQQPNNKKNNTNTIIIIIVLVLVIVLVGYMIFLKVNSNNNINNNQTENNNNTNEPTTIYKTISSKDLYDNNTIGSNFYKEYINKKVTITDLVVGIDGDLITLSAPGLRSFHVYCDNASSMGLTNGNTISVTGVVYENTPWSSDNNFYMKNCTSNITSTSENNNSTTNNIEPQELVCTKQETEETYNIIYNYKFSSTNQNYLSSKNTLTISRNDGQAIDSVAKNEILYDLGTLGTNQQDNIVDGKLIVNFEKNFYSSDNEAYSSLSKMKEYGISRGYSCN